MAKGLNCSSLLDFNKFSFMFLGRIHAAVNFRIKATLGYPKTLYFLIAGGFWLEVM